MQPKKSARTRRQQQPSRRKLDPIQLGGVAVIVHPSRGRRLVRPAVARAYRPVFDNFSLTRQTVDLRAARDH